MGKASREKRERKQEESLPEHLQFGPEFLDKPPVPEWVDLVVHAGVARATGKGGDS